MKDKGDNPPANTAEETGKKKAGNQPEPMMETEGGQKREALTSQEARAPSKAPKRKLALVIAALVLLVAAVALIAGNFRQNRDNPREQFQVALSQKPDHAGLIANWNQFAGEYPSEYQLFGDSAINSEAVVNTLKKWLAVATAPVTSEIRRELENLREEAGTTTFHKWLEFRESHHRDFPLEINAEMRPDQLATAINSYLGISKNGGIPDYVSKETVDTIIMLNSLCQYFLREKDNLHKIDIDTRAHSCKGLFSNGKYPALDALLN